MAGEQDLPDPLEVARGKRIGALEHPCVLGDDVAGDRVVGHLVGGRVPQRRHARSGPRPPRTRPVGLRTRCRRAHARCRSGPRGSRGRRDRDRLDGERSGSRAAARGRPGRTATPSGRAARPAHRWPRPPPRARAGRRVAVGALGRVGREQGEHRARPTARSTTTGRRPAGTVECTARSAPATAWPACAHHPDRAGHEPAPAGRRRRGPCRRAGSRPSPASSAERARTIRSASGVRRIRHSRSIADREAPSVGVVGVLADEVHPARRPHLHGRHSTDAFIPTVRRTILTP